MANFPGSEASFTGFTSGHTLQADSHASQHNLEQAEITATQHKIGTGASTPTLGMLLRGNGTGTSAWAQANLTTDVTGILPQANGGTGQNSLTGLTLPSPVITAPTISSGGTWSGSPTLTTPTIADFTNSTHNHQNTVGGGVLNGGSAITDNTITYAKLLSSIFGGQVASYTNTQSGGGTFYYINLGGLKICWGATGQFNTASTKSTTITIDLPPGGFFSHVRGGAMQACQLGSEPDQYATISSTIPSTNPTTIGGFIINGPSTAGAAAAVTMVLLGD